MPRIFIQPGYMADGRVTLPPEEARRFFRVLRMGQGDRVDLFDGHKEYRAVILSISPRSAVLEITAENEKTSEPGINIILGQGMPKGDKLEVVVQKSVELGVSEVVPVILERSVKRPDPNDMGGRLSRLKRIATEAAQQSGRVMVPEVTACMDLTMFLEHTRTAGLKILLYEGMKAVGLRDILRSAVDVKSVSLLIGPEGGLTAGEVQEAAAAGYVAAGLGPRILRTETAGPAVISIIQYELGDMG